MGFEESALVLAWVMILVLAFAFAGLTQQLQLLKSGNHKRTWDLGPKVGVRLANAELLDEFRTSVLLFTDSSCSACDWVEQELRHHESEDRPVHFTAIYRHAGNGLSSNGIRVLEYQQDLFQDLEIKATPFAMAVSSQGKVLAADPIGSSRMFNSFVDKAIEGGDAM